MNSDIVSNPALLAVLPRPLCPPSNCSQIISCALQDEEVHELNGCTSSAKRSLLCALSKQSRHPKKRKRTSSSSQSLSLCKTIPASTADERAKKISVTTDTITYLSTNHNLDSNSCQIRIKPEGKDIKQTDSKCPKHNYVSFMKGVSSKEYFCDGSDIMLPQRTKNCSNKTKWTLENTESDGSCVGITVSSVECCTKIKKVNRVSSVSEGKPKKRESDDFDGEELREISEAINSSPSSPQASSCRILRSEVPVSSAPSPGLTLSAFRRPEESVRLTDCPLHRHIHQHYHMARVLGHGATSTVRLAIRRSDGKRFAVKCIPKYSILREKRRFEEITILKALQHPNIVSLHDVFETENEVQLVVEYCPGGELFNAISGEREGNGLDRSNKSKCFSEEDAAKIISKVLSSLRYLHFLGIGHRDVKPENILLTKSDRGDFDVKLSDFGSARLFHPQELATILSGSHYGPFLPLTFHNADGTKGMRSQAYSQVGSDFYAAPEVRSGKGYDMSADLYSLGVTMYIILCGRFPPVSTDLSTEDHYLRLSSEARDLIGSLLDHDPRQRITAAEALSHKWIVRNNCGTENEESRRVKNTKMEIGLNLPLLFTASNLRSENFAPDVFNDREENDDNRSRDFNLRPTCIV